MHSWSGARNKWSLHCVPVVTSFFSPPPAASSISSESSPVSSPATNHSSPVSTPKRGPLGPGPVLVPPVGHSVPNTPPVVTIAPTKTSNGLWRSEGRQVRPARGHFLFAVFSLLPVSSPFTVYAVGMRNKGRNCRNCIIMVCNSHF